MAEIGILTMTEPRDGEIYDANLNSLGLDGVAYPVHAVAQLSYPCWFHQNVEPVKIAVFELQC